MGWSRDQKAERRKRIEHVIRTDPDLTNRQIAVRFGCDSSLVSNIRKKVSDRPAPVSEYPTKAEMREASAKHSSFVGALSIHGKKKRRSRRDGQKKKQGKE